MEYDVLSVVVLFLLVFLLALQIQVSTLNRKIEENEKNIRKIEEKEKNIDKMEGREENINKKINEQLAEPLKEKK